MKVTVERLPESRVQLEIEVDPERLEKTLETTYRKIAAKAKIAGFRPGKAPRQLVLQRLGGRPALIREALDDIVPDAYNAAIEEQDVHAIDQPDLEILEIEPVRFKATVPVRPTVELNDYTAVRVERNTVEVTDDDVAAEVLALRRRLAVHAPVDRPATWSDHLTADVRGAVEGEDPFVEDSGAEFPLREGAVLLVPGLAEAIVGMAREETREVDLVVPDDFSVEALRGKTAHFTVTLHEVKEEELPDEDDDLAAQVAEDLGSIDALRARVREQLQSARESAEQSRIQGEALAQMVERATLEYPRVLIEREIDHMVSEGVGNDAARYQQYLRAVGRSHAEFRETFREPAEQRVRQSLVLSTLTEVEGITVTEADIDAEIDRIAGPMGDDSARFRELFNTPDARDSIRRNVQSQRTVERIVAIATADAPAKPAAAGAVAETAPAAEGKAPGRRRTKASTADTAEPGEAAEAPARRPRKKKETAE